MLAIVRQPAPIASISYPRAVENTFEQLQSNTPTAIADGTG